MTKHKMCHLSNRSGSRGIPDKCVLSFKEKLSPPQVLLIHKEATINRGGVGPLRGWWGQDLPQERRGVPEL